MIRLSSLGLGYDGTVPLIKEDYLWWAWPNQQALKGTRLFLKKEF